MPSSPAASLKSKILQDLDENKNAQALKKAKLGVKKYPKDADFWSMAGFVLQSEKQYKKSAHFFLGAAKLRPRDAKDIENLISALEMSNQFSAAEKFLTKVISQHSDMFHIYFLLGNLFAKNEQWSQLAEFATSSLTKFPDKVELLTLRGTAYSHLSRYQQSYEDRHRAFELSPTHPMAARLYAQSLHQKGNKAKAKQILSGIVSRDPNDGHAIYDLAMLATPHEAEKLLKVIDQIPEGAVQEEDLPLYSRAHLIKISRDLTEALPVYAKANAIRFSRNPYDADAEDQIYDLTENLFSENPVTKTSPILETCVPVFVVGQPRSGTTLLEMMLSSSENVYGCGEMITVGQFCKKFQKKGAGFTAADAEDLAEYYFENLPPNSANRIAFVDKMPHNYQKLGFILSAFPNAKVVNILRDPRDTALSSWVQRFTASGIRHTNNFVAMAHSANLYRRYMEMWQKQFASQIQTVRYEHLTADPEGVMKSVAIHCGIPFDPAMTAPEKNAGTVKTASIDQVRSKISTNSVGNWQQAARELRPFLDALEFDLWPEYDF